MKWMTRNKGNEGSAARNPKAVLCMRILLLVAAQTTTAALAEPVPVIVQGAAVTGFNRLLDAPVMDLGHLGGFGFNTVAAFNPDGKSPIPLTIDSLENTLLSTMVDDAFLQAFFGDEPFNVDPVTVNVPLREVPTNTTPANGPYVMTKGTLDTEPYQKFLPGQAEPVYPITLGSWLQARGLATIQCSGDDEATVDLILGGLIPNRIYSVWGFFLSPDLTFPMKDFGPILPLGGVPNLFVSDKNGSGRFKRVLNFCPGNIKEDEVPLVNFFVVYHSDQMANGGMMSFPERSRFPGTSAHVQLQFAVH